MDGMSEPDRIFQMWSFTVGMSRLLLRSPRTSTKDTRIDVLFQNVKALKLPTLLAGLSVRSATTEELRSIENEIGVLEDRQTRVFVVEGTDYEGYVVASVMAAHEDQGSYQDPSALVGEP